MGRRPRRRQAAQLRCLGQCHCRGWAAGLVSAGPFGLNAPSTVLSGAATCPSSRTSPACANRCAVVWIVPGAYDHRPTGPGPEGGEANSRFGAARPIRTSTSSRCARHWRLVEPCLLAATSSVIRLIVGNQSATGTEWGGWTLVGLHVLPLE
jgi:hypothetical protein